MSQTSYDSCVGKFKHEEIMAVFRIFYKDGDGFITADEIQREMGNHGDTFTEQQVQQMMEGADSNGDGKIDYEEFVKLMQTNNLLTSLVLSSIISLITCMYTFLSKVDQ